MKANRSARKDLRSDETGLATVVGAILLIAVLISTLVTWQVVWQPKLDANAEAAHANQLVNQLGALDSVLFLQASNLSKGTVSSPIGMGTGSDTGFFSHPQVPDQVTFRPATSSVNVNSSKIVLLQSGGQHVQGTEEQWTGVTGSTVVSDIDAVSSFRLRIDSVNASNAPSHGIGDSITLTVRDSNNDFAGSLEVYVRGYSSGYSVNYLVKDANNQTLFNQGESYFLQDEKAPYWVDLLDQRFRFNRVLDVANTPFSVSLQENGLKGSYAITYVQLDSNGNPVERGAGGQPITDFKDSFTGGQLIYNLSSLHFPSQTYTLESGAIILDQPGGHPVFKVPPQFQATVVGGNFTSLRLSLPTLVGLDSARSGTQTITVLSDPLSGKSLTFQATDFHLRMGTDHPDLWRAYLTQQFEFSAFPSSYYTITTGPSYVDLLVHGASSNPDYYDMTVQLNQASIRTAVEG